MLLLAKGCSRGIVSLRVREGLHVRGGLGPAASWETRVVVATRLAGMHVRGGLPHVRPGHIHHQRGAERGRRAGVVEYKEGEEGVLKGGRGGKINWKVGRVELQTRFGRLQQHS
jgi:hypothetical protein